MLTKKPYLPLKLNTTSIYILSIWIIPLDGNNACTRFLIIDISTLHIFPSKMFHIDCIFTILILTTLNPRACEAQHFCGEDCGEKQGDFCYWFSMFIDGWDKADQVSHKIYLSLCDKWRA